MPSASGSSVFLHHWEPNFSSILWAKMYIVRWPLHLWEGHRCYLASRTFAQRTTANNEYPHVGLFLSPSIQNLKFMIGGQTDFTVNARSSLLPPLVSACPNLTHLCLFAKESLPWNDILFAISAISHWSSLRHLAAHFPAVWDPQLIEYENSMENPSMPVIGFTKLEHLIHS